MTFLLLGRISKCCGHSLMEATCFLQQVEEAKREAPLQCPCLEGICRSFHWLKLLKPHKLQRWQGTALCRLNITLCLNILWRQWRGKSRGECDSFDPLWRLHEYKMYLSSIPRILSSSCYRKTNQFIFFVSPHGPKTTRRENHLPIEPSHPLGITVSHRIIKAWRDLQHHPVQPSNQHHHNHP